MSRISNTLENLKRQGKSALIPYITAGDSHPGLTVPLMHSMVKAGANAIELGIPFSDPMADGPTIQLACERALKHHTSLRDVLAMVKEFRLTDTQTPVILMGYLNPLEAMGYEAFAVAAKDAGVDGMLTVDLPPEEAHDLLAALKKHHIDAIFLISPTTRPHRMQRIIEVSSGYLYYVSLKGVTGSNALNVDDVDTHVRGIKAHTTLPVGVGFGIKDATTAAAVSKVSDAVIVGSVLVKMIEETPNDDAVILKHTSELLTDMRQAMDKTL
ncbi:MAG: tryptophan synthase subunit alpha [Proteobacteria bacterium]|nr:MAG: tryptophan synthase subunit alpha [Pseudomonadota bacterium]